MPPRRPANSSRPSRTNGRREAPKPTPAVRKDWGSLARKGAESARDNTARQPSSREAERQEKPPARGEQDRWVRVAQTTKKRSGKSRSVEPFVLPKDAIAEIEERAGKRSERLVRNLRDAAKAYAAERWTDARKSLAPLLKEVGDAPIVAELNGMLLYRTGKWSAAFKELESAHLATQTFDLYPAMMDTQRALKRPKRVQELWDELRLASPGGEVMAEGRIVMAASLADQERFQDAIRLLEKTPKPKGEPKLYHLRSWYALADMYERKGDVGKARQLFTKVADADPDLADVLDRLDALR